MKQNSGKTHFTAAVLLGSAIGLAPAMAQEVGNVFTDEIVVTAQKREQNLQDVGIAVTAVSGEQMRALGYTNAQEITAMAPGVSTIQPNGEANYAIGIRGVTNSDFTTNTESPIAVYVDEVYISQMSGAGFMLFDMERAEILRGPQGTLFGRNATGGLVQYVTVKPSSEFEGYGSFAFGEYNQQKFQGAVNAPLTDNLAVRASFASNQRDGYAKNRLDRDRDLNNANENAVRLQLAYEMDEWSALLNLRQGRQDIRTGFFQNVSSVTPGQLTPDTVNPYLNGGYIDNDGDNYAGDYDMKGFNDLETDGYTLTLKRDGDVDFVSITDYQTVKRNYIEDSDASPDDYFHFFLTTDAEQFSQEFRLSGNTDASNWTAGAYYLDLKVDDSNGAFAHAFVCDYFAILTPEFLLSLNDEGVAYRADEAAGCKGDKTGGRWGFHSPYTTETESLSVFGQWEQQISDDMTVIAGVRVIDEEKTHDYGNFLGLWALDATSGIDRSKFDAPDGASYVFQHTRDDQEWAGRLQLDYRPADGRLYYASWNRGVKSGGFNAPLLPTTYDLLTGESFVENLDTIAMTYDPEQLDAFEVGFKLDYAESNITLNGAVFYYDYRDFQAFSIIGLDTFTLNAEAESYGWELELKASPADGLDILLGAGYVDTEVDKVPGVTYDLPGLPLGAATKVGQKVRPVQTPEWNLNGLIRYETAAPNLRGRVAMQVAAEYRDEHYFNLQNSAPLTEDGYTLVNLGLSYYPDASENLAFRFGVDNATDEEYIIQGFDLSGTITQGTGFMGMTEHYYNKPRMWSLSVDYAF